MKYWPLFFLLWLASCDSVVKVIEEEDRGVVHLAKGDAKEVSIGFSHNINGETHPCGCRKFPLGGIPQVAGIFHQWKQQSPFLYIDTGDTFFPAPVLPSSLEKSLKFTAKRLAKFLDDLGLVYMLPGDQDYAAGLPFLNELAQQHKFKFLISNLKSDQLTHLKSVSIKLPNGAKLVLMGVILPELLNHELAQLFEPPHLAIARELKRYQLSQQDRLVVLSHQGMDQDKELAKKFPRIDWIIGSHDQRFTQKTVDVGNTKIVQVLSRNHHMGLIQLSMSDPKQDTFMIQQVREEWQDKMPNNPFIQQLTEYKDALREVQKKEQQGMVNSDIHSSNLTIETAKNCITCHEAQGEFWQKTAHASAFFTLIQEKADQNADCIGCHSLYFQNSMGFTKASDFVRFEDDSQKKRDQYLKEFHKLAKEVSSIRDLSAVKRLTLAKKQMDLDSRFQVSQNFAHVQCLHCHEQTMGHPFDDSAPSGKVEHSSCTECHTQDQSPHWYHKNSSGKLGKLNQTVYEKKLKQVACPAME
jgi:hypothetical protein